ncbi:MAG: DUF362 domain-containing protein [Candidatus Bathyarchaeota archaeon]|nr:DUF362 domain-containing protein [Candidatus Bathyarchaeota archaeon]
MGYIYLGYSDESIQDLIPVNLKIKPIKAAVDDASEIFVVTGTNGADNGVDRLIDLMGDNGQPFYKSSKENVAQGSDGFIASNDVVLIKVNSQWGERGGTNTDLVSSIIRVILDHPDGWKGEIIVADNGQAQYGGAGRGGSLDWPLNNAVNKGQSIQDVVDMYAAHTKVSTYLWDEITSNVVQEFAEGDAEDGYVVKTMVISTTGTIVSYPKFTTKYGSQVSLKWGIYRPEIDDYDVDKLKVINVPVLKTHMIFGVTGAIKNYMGVPSDKLTAGLGYRAHHTVDKGGMGTLMAQTRVPTLNIIDAIHINAIPKDGPKTPYTNATETDIVAASTDPVAIDYWASKNILCRVCEEKGYGISTLDPDNTAEKEFGYWLRASMDELNSEGWGFTRDPARITVYVD